MFIIVYQFIYVYRRKCSVRRKMYESSCSYQGALELKRTTTSTCPLGIKTEEFSSASDWPTYRFCNPSTFEQLKQSVEKAKAALQVPMPLFPATQPTTKHLFNWLQDRTTFFGNASAFSDLYNVSSSGRGHQENLQEGSRLRDGNEVDIKRGKGVYFFKPVHDVLVGKIGVGEPRLFLPIPHS